MTNDNATNCLKDGYCKYNSVSFEYPIMTQQECTQLQGGNTFNGVCEICDGSNRCKKIPFGKNLG